MENQYRFVLRGGENSLEPPEIINILQPDLVEAMRMLAFLLLQEEPSFRQRTLQALEAGSGRLVLEATLESLVQPFN